MLKGISPLISSELLAILHRMGHGDRLVFADADNRSLEVSVADVAHCLRAAPDRDKVADRVVMVAPLERLGPDERQILFDGAPDDLEGCPDPRVMQFVRGEARERLMEMRGAQG